MSISRNRPRGWPDNWPDELANAMFHARDVLGRSTILTAGKKPYTRFLPEVDGKRGWKHHQNHLPDDEEIEDRRLQLKDAQTEAEKQKKSPGPLPGIALIPQPEQVQLDWDCPELLRVFTKLYHEREGVCLTVVGSRDGGHTLHDFPDGFETRCSGDEESIPELEGVGRPNRVKGHGGYTIGPPSLHQDDSTVQYRWMVWDPNRDDFVSCDPPTERPPVAPQWIVDWLSGYLERGDEAAAPTETTSPAQARRPVHESGDSDARGRFRLALAPHVASAQLDDLIARASTRKTVYGPGEEVSPGAKTGRNSDLHDFMSQSAYDIPESSITDVLVEYSKYKQRPPLPRTEIERTVARSGLKYVRKAQTQPRARIQEQVPASGNFDFRVFSVADEVENGEETLPIAEGIIPARAKVVLYGPGGVGKTWIALDLAMAVAEGWYWGSHFRCHQGKVLIFEAEMNQTDIRKRIDVLGAGRGFGPGEVKQLELYYSTSSNRVIEEDRYHNPLIVPQVEKAWRKAIETYQPCLLIIDSLSAIYGAEENSKGFKVLDDLLKRLIADYGLTVVLVHHTPKKMPGREEGQPRGSTILRDSMDTLIWVDHPDRFEVKKQRLIPDTNTRLCMETAKGPNYYRVDFVPHTADSVARVMLRILHTLVSPPASEGAISTEITGSQ